MWYSYVLHVWKFACTCIWLHIQHKADWYTCLYSKYLHAPVFDQLPIISVGHEFESGNKIFILGWDWVELEYNVNYSIMESSMLLTPLYPNLENTIKFLSILIVKMSPKISIQAFGCSGNVQKCQRLDKCFNHFSSYFPKKTPEK